LAAALQKGFCRLTLGWAHWWGGVVGASVVGWWQGGGNVTALAPACWCWRERDPTINMRWKVEGERWKGGGGETIVTGLGGVGWGILFETNLIK
jgi:hypothetical protein